MQVCASEDAEGRSSAVPLMVSAQELKCMLLTAWERVTCSPFTWENLFPAFPPSRKQTEPPPRKAKTHGCAACSRRGGVNLLPALSHSNRQRCEVASLALSPPLPPCSFKLDLWSCSLWLVADLHYSVVCGAEAEAAVTPRGNKGTSPAAPGTDFRWVWDHRAWL